MTESIYRWNYFWKIKWKPFYILKMGESNIHIDEDKFEGEENYTWELGLSQGNWKSLPRHQIA